MVIDLLSARPRAARRPVPGRSHEGTGYRIALRMMAIGAVSPEGVVRRVVLPYLLDLHRATGPTFHLSCAAAGQHRRHDI
ncbi:hypothetical protein C1J00_05020 [Streptomyces cahuitamycinicus]|uniref:Uncharacterized protein n=1 Tax=Streptomyces cahuitamycinicus TaxID=2070367 RepID=A0A2N8TW46_9ACTN|nr:hypothetical protein C1J00_05020 [Streptomyces cahuitamycinicus]